MANQVRLPAGAKAQLFWNPSRRTLFFIIFLGLGLVPLATGLKRAGEASDESGAAKAQQDIAGLEQENTDLRREAEASELRLHDSPGRLSPIDPAVLDNRRKQQQVSNDIHWNDIEIGQIKQRQAQAQRTASSLPLYIAMIVFGAGTWAAGFYVFMVRLPNQKEQVLIVSADQPLQPAAAGHLSNPGAAADALEHLRQEHIER